MTISNLAIIFGPTLMKKKDQNPVAIVRDMPLQARVVQDICTHYADIFD